MRTTEDRAKFKEEWTNYIDELDRLKSSLDPEHWDRLEEAKHELREVVQLAAIEVDDDE